MNIEARLEKEHSRKLTETIAKYVGDDPKRFAELARVFFEGNTRLCQRAAWAFSEVLLEHPHLLKPYFPKVLKKLRATGEHVAVTRNILRVLQNSEIPTKFEGPILDICLRHITTEQSPIAVRAFAITTAERLCRKYPELGNELRIILNELASRPQGPAISVRIKRAIKALGPAVS